MSSQEIYNQTVTSEIIATSSHYSSDYYMLITYIYEEFLFDQQARATVRQKDQGRTIFITKNMTNDLWNKFKEQMDINLYSDTSISDSLSINNQWFNLKRAIKLAAYEYIPKKKVMKHDQPKYPEEINAIMADL